MSNKEIVQDRRLVFPPTFRSGVLALALLGLCAYANAVFQPFVHDDWVFIVGNPDIRRMEHWGEIFHRLTSPPDLSGIANPYYRPLLEIFSRLEYRLFGLNPYGYHFVNVVIHLVNGALLYGLLARLLGRPRMAWCAAVLFVLHPVQSEAVAAVAGISNLLYVLMVLITWRIYLRREKWPLIFAVALYAIGLLVKEQVIILPVLLVLGDWVERRTSSLSAAVRRIFPFLVVAAGYFLWRKVVSGTAVTAWDGNTGELLLRLLALPRTLLMDLRMMVFPNDLHYYRSVDILQPVAFSPLILMVLLAAAGTVVGVMAKSSAETPAISGAVISRSRCAAFGLVWFLVTLLPVLNILPLIHEYSYIAAFEHFLYLPLAGFLVFLCAVVDGVLTKTVRLEFSRRTIASAVLILSASAGLLLTIHQNTFWRGDVELFENVVRYERGLGRAHLLLGKAYYNQGQYDRAVDELQIAQQIIAGYLDKVKGEKTRRVYMGFFKDIESTLGHCSLAKRQGQEAVKHFQMALVSAPDDSALHNDLGTAYIQLNDWKDACRYFQLAVDKDRGNLMAKSNWAVCLIQQGQRDEAERLLKEVLAIDPDFVGARQNLERLLRERPTAGAP